MLNKLSLRAKLILLCCTLTFFTGLVGFFSYKGIHDIEASNEKVVEGVVPSLELINSMALSYRKVRIHVRTLGLSGVTKEQGEEAIKLTLGAIDEYEREMKEYAARPFGPGEKELFEKLNVDWTFFKGIGGKAIALYSTGKPEDKEAMMKIFFVDCPEAAAVYTKSLENLITFHKTNLASLNNESKATLAKTNIIIITLGLSAFIISMVTGFLFSTKLSNSINNIVKNLQASSEALTTTSTQIASSSEELSQATTEQAASLQETSSSIEEINSMIQSNTDNARQSANASSVSLSNAEKGKVVVGDMIKAIDHIGMSNNNIMEQIDANNKEIEDIVKLINEIGAKTKVINDIVFQTKLLSFNASVEAARAGENGKGFAVVAEEVGNLAAMSGAAAIEISNMLDSSVKRVEDISKNSREKISKLIAEGKVSLDSGTAIATQCGHVLEEIVGSVASVSRAVSDISTACQEQSQGVQEVTKAISQLDQVTQENSANSAQSANSAAGLSDQAVMLNELVQDLVLIVDGNNVIVREGKASARVQKETPKLKVVAKNTTPVKAQKTAGGYSSAFPAADDPRFSDV